MGKPTICIGENKGADQLRRNCEADQRRCFRYSDSTISHLNPKFQASSSFCACTGRFVSDLFGNHIVGFPTRRLISLAANVTANVLFLTNEVFTTRCISALPSFTRLLLNVLLVSDQIMTYPIPLW